MGCCILKEEQVSLEFLNKVNSLNVTNILIATSSNHHNNNKVKNQNNKNYKKNKIITDSFAETRRNDETQSFYVLNENDCFHLNAKSELLINERLEEDNKILLTVNDITSPLDCLEKNQRTKSKKFITDICKNEENIEIKDVAYLNNDVNNNKKLSRNKIKLQDNINCLSLPEFSKYIQKYGSISKCLNRNPFEVLGINYNNNNLMLTGGFASLSNNSIGQEYEGLNSKYILENKTVNSDNINDVSINLGVRTHNKNNDNNLNKVINYNSMSLSIKYNSNNLESVKESNDTNNSQSINNYTNNYNSSKNNYSKTDELYTPNKTPYTRNNIQKNTLRKYQKYSKSNCRNHLLFEKRIPKKITDLNIKKYSYVFSDVKAVESKNIKEDSTSSIFRSQNSCFLTDKLNIRNYERKFSFKQEKDNLDNISDNFNFNSPFTAR